MKLATWNVNSLNVRLPHLLDWLSAHQPDVVCLQETKLEDQNFPLAEIEAAGYQAQFRGQKAYNGVAVLSRAAVTDPVAVLPDFPDEQRRVLAVSAGDTRAICLYVPNGQSVDSDKYRYKLQWLEALRAFVRRELESYPNLALLGDFNIAPEDRDVHDPKAWQGMVLVSEPERRAFRALQELGLADSFRLFPQPEASYSWWDYRAGGFRRNLGLRIDHILLSPALARRCVSCIIDTAPRKLERPSDHAPVMVEIGARALTGSQHARFEPAQTPAQRSNRER